MAFEPYATTPSLCPYCRYLLVPPAVSFIVIRDVFAFYPEEYVIVNPFVEWAYAMVSENFYGCVRYMAVDPC